MSFEIESFDFRYQPEVIALIERIQEGEFDIPIEKPQRKELQSIPASFQKDKGNLGVVEFIDSSNDRNSYRN